MKDQVEEMKNEMEGIVIDLDIVKQSLQKLQEDISNGTLFENGKKCTAAKKTGMKDCFEFAYEPIKAPAKGGAGGANGCCVIF